MNSNQSDESFDCDFLKPWEQVNEPDNRNSLFNKQLADFHQEVALLKLNDTVPRDITIQFETTKNLYLYSWFVYRFYPVSEHHALTCIELALRTRFESEIPKERYPRTEKPMLTTLLKYAIDIKEIKNEEFSRWQHRTYQNACSRYENSKIQEMHNKGLDQIELNYADVEISDEDRDWSYIEALQEYIPYLRNHYAHGSTTLHNQVLDVIRTASEIINQIYPAAISSPS